MCVIFEVNVALEDLVFSWLVGLSRIKRLLLTQRAFKESGIGE